MKLGYVLTLNLGRTPHVDSRRETSEQGATESHTDTLWQIPRFLFCGKFRLNIGIFCAKVA